MSSTERTWRDRLADICWRLIWSDYTSWRQDRAFRRWAGKQTHP